MSREPTTLKEAIEYFSDPKNCREYMVARRWPDGVTCPRCGSKNVKFSEKHNRWQCCKAHPLRQFTLKTGTVMKDSPIGLDKWLMAMWQIVNSKNGISSWEVHRAIGVTQKTAWFLDHRIRFALGMAPGEKASGHVEADETFIDGKARNMHIAERKRRITRTGSKDKAGVMGILERGKDGKPSKIRTTVVPSRYVDGKDTKGLENFWSLLKRGISGTYVSVEPFHLFRYLDEQVYRFNNRHINDAEHFDITVRGIVGKCLTYDQLTGKPEEPQA